MSGPWTRELLGICPKRGIALEPTPREWMLPWLAMLLLTEAMVIAMRERMRVQAHSGRSLMGWYRVRVRIGFSLYQPRVVHSSRQSDCDATTSLSPG
ncbi:hypothetical protein K437DRAFT_257200 [Tilletiaria anomala UBC 951]|uniref:Uncharacterized protein n=1 Tax=Tilletiaria anomala (strain ATCC 24038 / CBS 436.72 / UBC 951) TaxID=1037660 RepID=A0A066VZU6_TILAU|nr:uncharacterized protein K437DRAFT_257200 [Tilletiaria anomala UBC 951]KDN44065.1 hypothetical protein K437DRAFT_257200 [Tilletiaria anomala UBC 951]